MHTGDRAVKVRTTMVSEACATGKPVHVLSMGEEPVKLRQFHKTLTDNGVTRPFTGRIEHWTYDPPNETDKIAAIIRDRLYRSFAIAGGWGTHTNTSNSC
jgi:uncharacterized protein